MFTSAYPARLFVFSASILLSSTNLLQPAAHAQESPALALPNAPEPEQSVAQSVPATPQQAAAAGKITGTIVDADGAVVQGAHVELTGPSGVSAAQISGRDGQYVFPGLPAGDYEITVTGKGMSSAASGDIALGAGEYRTLPNIALVVSGGVTSVTVSGDKEELSREQEHIAVQQRVIGVIPNFYSSYDWNAPPMLAKQKFQLSARGLIDPVSFLAVAGIAGAEQNRNIFPSYGGGIEGYGKRYGAAMANRVSGALLGRAVYPAIFHQDPRYFYKGKGSIKSRALYAISAAVMTRSDSGRWEPNYSQVLGNFSAAALSNLYYPQADRGGSLVLLNGLSETGGNAVSNLIREFLLKPLTSHANNANGQP
ncbi:carboxypeptidase-like regulatory domain-containing protein [Telmatobacter sp. DSM 110680]|uniref:Carboxypeptidase-like regulatory domain-containing protein n=1 Tax=Telmatobacter sp. DSM 110680 TaxID=3036704 RepID=A0AAU7DMJ5_9BACT